MEELKSRSKIPQLISCYNSLTPIGLALEGFKILQKIDQAIKDENKEDIRDVILSWLN